MRFPVSTIRGNSRKVKGYTLQTMIIVLQCVGVKMV